LHFVQNQHLIRPWRKRGQCQAAGRTVREVVEAPGAKPPPENPSCLQKFWAALYPSTLVLRSVFLAGFLGFYLHTRDPLFLVVLGVVGLGVLMTGTSYWLDLSRSGGSRG